MGRGGQKGQGSQLFQGVPSLYGFLLKTNLLTMILFFTLSKSDKMPSKYYYLLFATNGLQLRYFADSHTQHQTHTQSLLCVCNIHTMTDGKILANSRCFKGKANLPKRPGAHKQQ